MWNFFSRETFPYEIGEKYSDFCGNSVFNLHEGTKKSTGDKVAIFSYSVKGGNSASLENARNSVKKLKTLKHPSILTYIDSYEDENFVHLVTDPVTPLHVYLKEIQQMETTEMYYKWGLSTIGEAVKFLNDHNQRHNNIFHGSVFVDNSGSWRLGEVGYISSDSAPFPQKVVDYLSKYNISSSQMLPGYVDYWGLGVLIWEVFNGALQSQENLKNPRKIPKNLVPSFKDLISRNLPKTGIFSTFIERCSESNMLFTTLDNLQNYHLKDKDVKSRICKDLLQLLPNIPKDMLLNKVLRLLKQAYDFDSENSAFLVPVVSKIPSLITEEEFQSCVEQFVITLFSSNDRATRFALLMNIEEIINKINKKSINELFPYFSTGFLDSNPKIRGETVKALVHFAPKLSKKHLNDEALRHLLQIQSKDPEAYIRTNATICLGKVAHGLQPDTRKKVLIPAFLHALRDPFPAVRNSGVQAFAVTHRFYPLDSIARSVLPGLACLTVDPDTNVRQNAFKTIKVLFSKLEKFSESPELKEELEKDVMSQTVENSSSWSGWAFAAITSKFLKTDSRNKPVEQVNSENKNISDDAVPPRKSSGQLNPHLGSPSSIDEKPVKEMFSSPRERLDLDSQASSDTSLSLKSRKEETNLIYSADKKSDDDGSDWDDDGWGEAHEEVLESPVSQKPIDQQSSGRKKNLAGPMKLGTRLSK